ncbi:MAG: hypothetical protein KDD53_03985 [Bdellovibrionales bacterium]|nr:hypothetical protein [Bdellovibrionales bacterium]
MKTMTKRNMLLAFVLSLCLPLVASAKAGDIKSEGTISALSSASVTVAGKTYLLNSSTEYEDLDDSPLSFSDFTVGDFVEVKGFLLDDVLVARELQRHIDSNDSDDDSDDDSSDDSDDDSSDDDDDSDDDSSSEQKEKYHSNLSVPQDVDSSATGRARYREETKQKHNSNEIRRKVVIRVKVPLASVVPAASTTEELGALELAVSLTHQGSADPYARCYLVLDRVGESSSAVVAQYVLKAREKVRTGKKNKTTVKGKGVCDIDLDTDDIQKGLPDLDLGDRVEVEDLTIDGATVFLSGEI